MKFRVLDLFAGIGGFSLGLERTGGFETVAFCEIEEKCHRVLKKHWPDVPIYKDIKELTSDQLQADGVVPDVLTGGFPCTDISGAQQHRPVGIHQERSGLWKEYARLISEVMPQWCLIENVPLLRSRGLHVVLSDLWSLGYDCEWHCIPARSVGAPHERDRIWIVAYTDKPRLEGWLRELLPERPSELFTGPGSPCTRELPNYWDPDTDVLRVANGIPNRVDRIKQIGNSVVPQIPELIGQAILLAEGKAQHDTNDL
jgi:DNA (cytosine-5)-methyltransferase 1